MMETKSRYELKKEEIYLEFLRRCKLALNYLLDDIILNYKRIIDSSYTITEEEKKDLIDNCIGSAMSLKQNR